MISEKYETTHDSRLDRLVEQFGNGFEDKIKKMYDEERIRLEKDAKIKSFIPLLCYKFVKDNLMQKYGCGSYSAPQYSPV